MSELKAFLIKKIHSFTDQYIAYPLLVLSDRLRGVDFYKIEVKDSEHVKDVDDPYDLDDNDLYDIYLYESTHLRVDRQLKRICRNVSRKDSIIDVGCGKGRMLAFFSKFSFGRVDGLELDRGLCRIAKRNLNRLGVASRIMNIDATEFRHWDKYNYFYFYNPFPEEIMDVVLDHILMSLKKNPRTITALYANPVWYQSFLKHGFTEIPLKADGFEKIWRPYISGLRVFRYVPA